MATFLKDKAHFFSWDIGNAESIGSYFDIKDLLLYHTGDLITHWSLQQDGLYSVYTFNKYLMAGRVDVLLF